MLPLVGIATAVIPELIKLIAGDRAGKVADSVAEAVSTATGTTDPQAAQKKIDEDPAVAAALRIKLAEIALQEARLQNEKEAAERTARLQAEDKQRQDSLDLLRTQFENDQKLREQQFAQQQAQMKAALEQTASARALQLDLIKVWRSHQVGAHRRSRLVVTLLFASALVLLLYGRRPAAGEANYSELINICIGALVAGFSTVISYWLGSSQGSREKDTAAAAVAGRARLRKTPSRSSSSPVRQRSSSGRETRFATGPRQRWLWPCLQPPRRRTSVPTSTPA